MNRYVLGLDFGTLSGRALLVDVATGEEVSCGVENYAHGVLCQTLPDGTVLPPECALQHPGDYLEVLGQVVRRVLDESGIQPEQIIGIGMDFTACTLLPVDRQGQPLCFRPEFASRSHAYVSLWKDHTARRYTEKIQKIAEETDPDCLIPYGGRMFEEWMIPKCYGILQEDPEIYDAAWRIMEAGNWLIYLLTGREVVSPYTASFKAMWQPGRGYPSNAFFRALDPRMADFVNEKLGGADIVYQESIRAGVLSEAGAALVGLCPGTPVAIPLTDAHAALPGAGITQPGKLMLIMGTSFCHIMLSEKFCSVPGMMGIIRDGLIQGYYCYEGGQTSGGDHLDWFVNTCIPEAYKQEASRRGISVHQLLRDKVIGQQPGQSGLLALDWFNGNRSILWDSNLSGLILGCTLTTLPEEIYRALVEASVFGTRRIVDALTEHGVEIECLCAAGGIARKDEMMMQILADVVNRPVQIAGSHQAPALGAAVFAAVAAGRDNGGYESIETAAAALGRLSSVTYLPDPRRAVQYNRLYNEYRKLYDYFGTGQNNVMKELKKIQEEALHE